MIRRSRARQEALGLHVAGVAVDSGDGCEPVTDELPDHPPEPDKHAPSKCEECGHSRTWRITGDHDVVCDTCGWPAPEIPWRRRLAEAADNETLGAILEAAQIEYEAGRMGRLEVEDLAHRVGERAREI